jgi:hypothetical protein
MRGKTPTPSWLDGRDFLIGAGVTGAALGGGLGASFNEQN